MSLKNLNNIAKIGVNGKDGIDGFLNSIKDLSQSQQLLVVNSTALTAEQRGIIASSIGATVATNGQVVATETLVASEGKAIATTNVFSASLKSLWLSMKSTFVALATNPLTWAVAIGAAAIALEDFFTVDYGEATDALAESTQKYQETKSNLESLNSELQTTKSRISELQALKTAGTITFAEEAELESLQSQNAELERKIELQEKLVAAQSQASINDAKELMTKGDYSVAQSVKMGDSSGKSNFKNEVKKVTDTEAIKEDIKLINEYKAKLPELEENIISLKAETADLSIWDDSYFRKNTDLQVAEKELQHYQDSIETLYSDLDTRASSIQSVLDTLKLDPTANADAIRELESALNSINDIDLTPTQQQLASIESFFNGSTGSNFIKDKLLEAVKSGQDATDALHAMGITLDDLGITGEGTKASFNDYFDGLVKSAEEAQDAIKSIDGSVSGVKSAFESENQDADWNSMADYLKQAQELYNKGKVGTDDFKAAAQFMTPDVINPDGNGFKYDADAYVSAWKNAQDKIKKYFDSNNPLQSVVNFSNDLVNKGLATKVGDEYTWGFKNSAEAADELGLSVQAVETLMHSLESYGAEFDKVMWSGEGIDRYQSALEGIKSLRDSMTDGDSKKRLSNLIDNWDSELERYQTDLSALTEDQIVHIEFEYDLATIQQQIDELAAKQKGEGGKNSVTNASIIAGNEQYISKAEKGLGLLTEGVDVAVNFRPAKEAIDNLYNDLASAEVGSDQYFEIQAKIQNAQEIYKDLLNGFSEKHPEITVDSNADEVKAAWADFLGQKQHLKVDGELDTASIENQLSALTNGSSITFTADIDGVEKEIKALKNEKGEIVYTTNVDGTELPVEVTEKDGEVKYEVDSSKVDNYEAPDKYPSAKYKGDFSGIGNAPTKYGTVIYSAKGAITGAAGIGGKVVSNFQYTGTLLSPAHANGTAYNVLNLKPAYANGKVALTKDEQALVNELGTESIIRGDTWSLLPGGMHVESLKKGDIVLNAQQTADLLRSGKTNGHARAYANGTLLSAYANGFRLPSSSGASTTKSYQSTTTKKSTSSNTASKAAQAATQAAEDLFDFVESLLERTKETTEKLTDAIDDAVNLADKMSKNSSALTQVQKEISVNQQAYQKYLAQANAVGLAENYASQIRNGSLNIENITDEDLKKKIDNYQKWYEKAKSCQDAIRDLQKDEKELALDRLDYIESYYDAIISLNDAYKDVNDARLDYLEKLGSSAITDDIKGYYQNSYTKEYDSYGKALQQLSDYTQEVNELLSNGYLQEGSEDYLEAMKTIQEFTKQVDESATALIELEDKIREIDYTKLQQLIDGYGRRTDQLKNAQSLAEARDELIGRDVLQKQVDELSKGINANYALRDAKLKEQNLYDVTSTRYQELAEEIAKLDGEIYGSLEDIEDLKNQIFEAEFFNYDKEQKNLEYFIGELSDFAKLLNEEAYFDKNGAFTDEAYAKIALVGKAMSKTKQETANATEALRKLDEMYQNGLISSTEFDERQKDLLDTIRDSVSATEDYKKELIDLYKNQMEESNDKLKENIKLRQDALKNAKDYEDFADSLKDKTKTVNELDAQINALQNVNNSQAKAELKRLMAQREEAQKSLDDLKKDHTYDLMNEGNKTVKNNL